MIRETAPAKVNLVLQVGPHRADGLHELCSLFAALDLADELTIEPARNGEDEVVCDRVTGENLAGAALAAFRQAADLPPLRVTIDKRIPVAAGLGGGSADAAATLRAANEIAGHPLTTDELRALGAGIGADVPSQVEPRHALVTGAGEHVEPLELPDMALVLVPAAEGLATGDVYKQADRIGSVRAHLDPGHLRHVARAPLAELARNLENDLEAAALSLRPELARTIDALEEEGALAARVTGSGPTVYGVFTSRTEAANAARIWSNALVTSLLPTPR